MRHIVSYIYIYIYIYIHTNLPFGLPPSPRKKLGKKVLSSIRNLFFFLSRVKKNTRLLVYRENMNFSEKVASYFEYM